MSWRSAGLNYVNYSNIAARTLRRSLKSELKVEALKRDEATIRFFYWSDGVMLKEGEKLAASPSAGVIKEKT